jgi:uncharacterized protein YndB with AHSA1/START domain
VSRPDSDDTIVLDIEIAAPPDRVFEALTDPHQLGEWWSMEQEPVSWELDLRVGGRWRAVGSDETCGEWVLSGEVLELDPPRVLAYSWSEHSASKRLEGTLVRYVLTPTTSGTRLRLTHSGFGDAVKARDEYRRGWPGVSSRLKRYLAPS